MQCNRDHVHLHVFDGCIIGVHDLEWNTRGRGEALASYVDWTPVDDAGEHCIDRKLWLIFL